MPWGSSEYLPTDRRSSAEAVTSMDDEIFGDQDEDDFGADDLAREWKAREAQFRTHGYRDGITAGKNASVQEGFNSGFRESARASVRWGQARGVASALAALPPEAATRLVPSTDSRAKLAALEEDMRATSSQAAAAMFYQDYILARTSPPITARRQQQASSSGREAGVPEAERPLGSVSRGVTQSPEEACPSTVMPGPAGGASAQDASPSSHSMAVDSGGPRAGEAGAGGAGGWDDSGQGSLGAAQPEPSAAAANEGEPLSSCAAGPCVDSRDVGANGGSGACEAWDCTRTGVPGQAQNLPVLADGSSVGTEAALGARLEEKARGLEAELRVWNLGLLKMLQNSRYVHRAS